MFSEKDVKIEKFRASGNGGQNVNKVENAVRLTHLPTGLQAQSQDERSYPQNLKKAMSVLQQRVLDRQRKIDAEVLNAIRQQALDNGRMRTYNHVTKTVKDHRTGKTYPLQEFMDGKVKLND